MIPGLFVYPDFVDDCEHDSLLEELYLNDWNSTIPTRRVQHYGYYYDNIKDSRGFSSDKARKGKEITGCLEGIRDMIQDFLGEKGILSPHLNQCIVNEYGRSSSIGAHTDNKSFGDVVVSLCLSGDCNFTMTREEEEVILWCPKKSLIILSGEARYSWKHSIKKNLRQYKPSDGCVVDKLTDVIIIKTQDYRRVSITFRSL